MVAYLRHAKNEKYAYSTERYIPNGMWQAWGFIATGCGMMYKPRQETRGRGKLKTGVCDTEEGVCDTEEGVCDTPLRGWGTIWKGGGKKKDLQYCTAGLFNFMR